MASYFGDRGHPTSNSPPPPLFSHITAYPDTRGSLPVSRFPPWHISSSLTHIVVPLFISSSSFSTRYFTDALLFLPGAPLSPPDVPAPPPHVSRP